MAIALVLWSTLYVVAGGLFQDEVRSAIEWASSQVTSIVVALALLVVLAVLWRFMKVRRHRALHAAHARD